MQALQDLIKNKEKMAALVGHFYDLLSEESSIKHFFENADRENLERKQLWFLTSLLLGETQGTADYMSRAHGKLVKDKGLSADHFDTMLNCLEQAMSDFEVPDTLASEISIAASKLKDAVLGKEPWDVPDRNTASFTETAAPKTFQDKQSHRK